MTRVMAAVVRQAVQGPRHRDAGERAVQHCRLPSRRCVVCDVPQEYKGTQPAQCASFHTLKTSLRADVKRLKDEVAAAAPEGVTVVVDDVAVELGAAIDMELATVRVEQVRLWLQSAMVMICDVTRMLPMRAGCAAGGVQCWSGRGV